MTVKYLLLDIDGVLTNARDIFLKGKIPRNLSEAHRGLFCAQSLNLVKMFIEHTDVKVVIFSTWAARYCIKDFSEFFGFEVCDKIVPDTPRSLSIEEWLISNPEVGQHDFVVLDDNNGLRKEHTTETGIRIHTQCVHVNKTTGVTINDIDSACEKLRTKDYVNWPKIFF